MTQTDISNDCHHEPFHYNFRAFFVGLFILIPAILIVIFVVFQFIKFGYLEQWFRFEVRFSEVYNLQPTADVTFRGVKIGQIERISLDEAGYVSVRLKIRQKYYHLMRESCVAQLVQKNFPIGDWQIKLKKDAQSRFELSEGAVMPGQDPLALDTLLVRLETVLSGFETVSAAIRTGEGVLGQLLSDDSIGAEISGLRTRTVALLDQVDALLQKADKTVNNADVMIDHMDEFGRHGTMTIDNFNGLAHKAAQLITKMDRLSDNLERLALNLNELPPEISAAIHSLKRDLAEAEILLKGLQNHWLLRKAVQNAREHETTSDQEHMKNSGDKN